MDLKKKLEYTQMHIKSIAEHEDVDAEVRKGALDKVQDMVDEARAKITDKVREQIDQL